MHTLNVNIPTSITQATHALKWSELSLSISSRLVWHLQSKHPNHECMILQEKQPSGCRSHSAVIRAAFFLVLPFIVFSGESITSDIASHLGNGFAGFFFPLHFLFFRAFTDVLCRQETRRLRRQFPLILIYDLMSQRSCSPETYIDMPNFLQTHTVHSHRQNNKTLWYANETCLDNTL